MNPEAIDQLFAALKSIWGRQKFLTTYGPPAGEESIDWMEDMTNLWANQLAAYSPEVLQRAVQALIDAGGEWPPTLPEFKAICADFRRSEPAPVEALPPPAADRELGRAALDLIKGVRIGAEDPMFWAKRPKSAAAVDLIVRGIQRDPSSKLKAILAGHLADIDRAPVRSEEARQRLREIKESA
jgi:hypothetical protein